MTYDPRRKGVVDRTRIFYDRSSHLLRPDHPADGHQPVIAAESIGKHYKHPNEMKNLSLQPTFGLSDRLPDKQ